MFLLRIFIILTISMISIPQSKASELTDLGKGITKTPKGVLGIIVNNVMEDEKTTDKSIAAFIWCLSKARQLNSNSTVFTAHAIPISQKFLNMRFFNTITAWIDLKGGDKLDLSFIEVARYCNTLFNLIEESPKSEKLKYCAISYETDIHDIIEKKQSLLTHNICLLFVISHNILSDYKICKKKEWTMVPVSKEQVVPLYSLYFITTRRHQKARDKNYFFKYFWKEKQFDAAAEILDENNKSDIAKLVRHNTDLKQYEKGIFWGKKLLLFKDAIIDYGIDIARLYARNGKFSDAVEICTQVLKAQKNRLKEGKFLTPDTHYCMAFYLIRDNKPAESFPYLKIFIELSEKTPKEKLKFPLRKSFIKGIEMAIENEQIVFDSIEEKNKFRKTFSEIQSKFVIKEDEY